MSSAPTTVSSAPIIAGSTSYYGGYPIQQQQQQQPYPYPYGLAASTSYVQQQQPFPYGYARSAPIVLPPATSTATTSTSAAAAVVSSKSQAAPIVAAPIVAAPYPYAYGSAAFPYAPYPSYGFPQQQQQQRSVPLIPIPGAIDSSYDQRVRLTITYPISGNKSTAQQLISESGPIWQSVAGLTFYNASFVGDNCYLTAEFVNFDALVQQSWVWNSGYPAAIFEKFFKEVDPTRIVSLLIGNGINKADTRVSPALKPLFDLSTVIPANGGFFRQ